VQARAPEPVSTRPLPVYAPGSKPPVLPHPQPVNAGMPARHGEVSARESEPPHAGPGSAAAPQPAHPTPVAMGHDQARSEHEYPGGYEHQQPPQAQGGDHKSPPQPQNQNHAPPPAQPQNGSRPPQQQNGGHQAQPQNDHHNAAPQPQVQNQHQGGGSAHPQNDNHSHKSEGQPEKDPKHDRQSNEH